MNEGLLPLHGPGKEEFQTQVLAVWAVHRVTPFGENHRNTAAHNPGEEGLRKLVLEKRDGSFSTEAQPVSLMQL